MRLRSLAALTAVTLLLVACGAGPITQADRDAIDAVRDSFEQAVLAGDVEGTLATYTDDAVEMPPNMPIRNGQSAIRDAAEEAPQMSSFSLTPVETDGVGDLAYDRGTYTGTVSMAGMPEPMTETGKYLVLLKKQADGSWLISTAIWNSDTPPPPMPEGQM
jgi:uncharacterized protein (TIGR02246 family)